jgi:hypothetical protein
LFQSGNNAAALTVAEQYVQAFGNLAKTSNTVILPANAGDAASMVAQVGISLVSLIMTCHCKNRLVEMTNLNWLSQTHLFLTNFIWSKQP